MSSGTLELGCASELIRIYETLTPEKQREVFDFAEFLALREEEKEWDKLNEKRRPKLEAFIEASISKGHQPMDFTKL